MITNINGSIAAQMSAKDAHVKGTDTESTTTEQYGEDNSVELLGNKPGLHPTSSNLKHARPL